MSNHWYTQDAEPLHQIMKKDNSGYRTTTVSDARKMNLFPSVTTVLKILDKPSLFKYYMNNALEAASMLSRLPEETIEDYSKRIMEQASTESKKAKETGTAFHQALEGYIKTGEFLTESQQASQIFVYNQNYIDSLNLKGNIEKTFVNYGYAGTIDFIGEATINGERNNYIIDFKTTSSVASKDSVYDEYIYQLAAYKKLAGVDYKCVNIIFSTSSEKNIFTCTHSDSDIQTGIEIFEHALQIFKKKNKLN